MTHPLAAGRTCCWTTGDRGRGWTCCDAPRAGGLFCEIHRARSTVQGRLAAGLRLYAVDLADFSDAAPAPVQAPVTIAERAARVPAAVRQVRRARAAETLRRRAAGRRELAA